VYDLIVVGAGPAGSSAARTGGLLGLRTLVLEQHRFPRYKPCGGAISVRASAYLGFDLPAGLVERPVYGARLCYDNEATESRRDQRVATLVTRSAFDDFLLRASVEAGVSAVTGVRVTGLVEYADRVEVKTGYQTYRARYVIIAEGAQGGLYRLVRRRDHKSQYGVCVVTEVPADDASIDRYIRDAIAVHFGVARMGYGWVFPHAGYFSVGIGGLARDMRNPKAVMRDFLARRGFCGSYRLRGHLIPVGGIKRRLSTRRILLVGDAAGFVDSFSGEGIAYAVRSGQIAAATVSEALGQPQLNEYVSCYADRCDAEFGEDLRHSLVLARLLHFSPTAVIRAFVRSSTAVEHFLEVPARVARYRDFVRWLVPHLPSLLLKSRRSQSGAATQHGN